MDTDRILRPKLKGILKRTCFHAKVDKGRLKWDEQNLQLIESPKNPKKLKEYKTPYIYYDSVNDVLLSDLKDIPIVTANPPPLKSENTSLPSHPCTENECEVKTENSLIASPDLRRIDQSSRTSSSYFQFDSEDSEMQDISEFKEEGIKPMDV
ncbi:hypothetical protein K7432_006465 [Basidiobolus ranarum]|uniref:Uncharacterized protein n=1 Tax=Basidiobolus ranarum TaxID=34480 RepID=A0ABR2W1J3_9FUNG